ncbi:hypothetical protein [Cohnella sp. AR92]|uniref:COG4705 family protein n=1 Tax=Cohnella sp. AR92 TaxID=648716 RepID=UPI000F8E0D66|nr:hypothetical protein [Cohnella sp. AR92]RUS46912.1 hypothetical protein ELR57_10915 [Cohnella sp. AR92]
MDVYPNKRNSWLSKVPEVTIFFWIIKVLCTTVGETFSDYLSVNVGLGLPLTTGIMGIAFVLVLFLQFKASRYIPFLYWLTVVLISVFGTLVTDNLTDGIGVPLETSTIVFAILLGVTLLVWFLYERTLSIHSIYTRRREAFYWLTILFTFALGTAVGDLYSEQLGLGYLNTGILVVAIIAVVFLAWKFVKLNEILAFWTVYILTRPLGASLGDYLSQSKLNGGLGLGATLTSVIFLIAILAIIAYLAVSKIDLLSTKEGTAAPIRVAGNRNAVLTQTLLVVCLFLVACVGGYEWRSNRIASQPVSSQATLSGQLTAFIQLEEEMVNLVNNHDAASAKPQADQLERDWDKAEPTLRKIDRKTWTDIDGTIDGVLAAVRSKKPDEGKCRNVLADSLNVLNAANQ